MFYIEKLVVVTWALGWFSSCILSLRWWSIYIRIASSEGLSIAEGRVEAYLYFVYFVYFAYSVIDVFGKYILCTESISQNPCCSKYIQELFSFFN